MTAERTPPSIRIVADAHALSAWVPALAAALERRIGARTAIEIAASGGASSSALATLLSLETLVLRRGRPCWSDRIDAADLAPRLATAAPSTNDIVIDLTAGGAAGEGATVLRPLYDGAAGEEALASALFFSGTPRISILRIPPGGEARIVAEGVASLEAATGIGGAMEAVWSRALELLLKAMAGAADGRTPDAAVPPRPIPLAAAALRGTKEVASAAARAAYRLCCHAPHWRVGWRRTIAGQDVWTRRDLGGGRWNVLPDPGDHFYADPFPLHHQGRDHLFFEDLDHKTGKGVISVVTFDDDGRPGPAVPVLEEPWHLSYPFLIEAEGQIWMIPEASLSGAVSLYRAVDFPYHWERHADLLTGLEAADATIVAHGGLLYLFAVVRDGVGGYSDTLSIWHAHSLFGPWRPHAQNPVLVDDRSARPAGNFAMRDGALMRPVQDCRGGYGGALGLARIVRLDPEQFEQTVETHLAPGPHWPGRKLHTLNGNGRLEAIDGSVLRPKPGAAAALVERLYRP